MAQGQGDGADRRGPHLRAGVRAGGVLREGRYSTNSNSNSYSNSNDSYSTDSNHSYSTDSNHSSQRSRDRVLAPPRASAPAIDIIINNNMIITIITITLITIATITITIILLVLLLTFVYTSLDLCVSSSRRVRPRVALACPRRMTRTNREV